MKVTVCEVPNNWTDSDKYWNLLIQHLEQKQSNMLVLPEMPFFKWITRYIDVTPELWEQAVISHDAWIDRLNELPVELIIASRPAIENNQYLNKGFIFTRDKGIIFVHDKYYLPDEPGFYEASWYKRGKEDFNVVHINGIKIGFLICTEIWFTARARQYLKQDVDIIVCPRATPESKVDIWVTGGKAAAIVSGAFCLSSNYNGQNTQEENFGGTGWIIEPERGDVLETTSANQEFLTLDIDINDARKAKATYPRYVEE
jgi:N-carbamoylputrescine amidase